MEDIRRKRGDYKAAVEKLAAGHVAEGLDRLDTLGAIKPMPAADLYGHATAISRHAQRDTGNPYQGFQAWFKNARFRVTLGISARTLIGPALERVYASPWLPCWGFSSARTACTPEVPASERAVHPSATPRDSCRPDWGLHCAGTGGGSGRTEATSSSPSPTAAAGRSSFAAGC